jgi:hypothetical protein
MKKNIFNLCIFFNLFFQALTKEYSADTIKLNWIDNGDSINITMTNQMSRNNWFSFGLSNDQLMVIIYFLQFFLLKRINILLKREKMILLFVK